MKIIKLNTITLDYSSIPEDQYDGTATADGEWLVGTSYVADDIVYYTGETPHKVYKALDSTTGDIPPDSPTKWGDLGATDRWRVFDQYVNTQSEDTSPLEMHIDAGGSDTAGFFNLSATSLLLTQVIDTDITTSISPSLGTGWSADAGNSEYDCDGSQTTDSKISYAIATNSGFYYEFTFTVQNYSSGNIYPYINTTKGSAVSSNSTNTLYVQSDGSSDIGFVADSNFVGSVSYTLDIKLCGKRETVSLVSSATTGWYSYYTTPAYYANKLIWTFPKYSSSTLKVQIINSTSDSACGVIGIGESYDIGYTDYGAEFGILDYSYKSTDSVTGDTFLQQGNFADEGSFDLWLEYSQIEYIKKVLTDVRGVAAIYDFNNEDDNEELLFFYGFYEKFRVTIPAYRLSRCALDIQGLI